MDGTACVTPLRYCSVLWYFLIFVVSLCICSRMIQDINVISCGLNHYMGTMVGGLAAPGDLIAAQK